MGTVMSRISRGRRLLFERIVVGADRPGPAVAADAAGAVDETELSPHLATCWRSMPTERFPRRSGPRCSATSTRARHAGSLPARSAARASCFAPAPTGSAPSHFRRACGRDVRRSRPASHTIAFRGCALRSCFAVAALLDHLRRRPPLHRHAPVRRASRRPTHRRSREVLRAVPSQPTGRRWMRRRRSGCWRTRFGLTCTCRPRQPKASR